MNGPDPVPHEEAGPHGDETASLTIDEAAARLPEAVVAVLADRLRGNFREVRRYRPKAAPARSARGPLEDPLEGLESEAEMDPESD